METLALILAGGKGTRLDILSEKEVSLQCLLQVSLES